MIILMRNYIWEPQGNSQGSPQNVNLTSAMHAILAIYYNVTPEIHY